MDRVFVSSVIAGYAAERQAAKDAIESLDLRPLMAESGASSPDPSKTALLGLIDRADAVVLLLAGRYGYKGDSGLSPTEDEYAVATETPVLAFVHEGVEREPEQAAFIQRVRGGWETSGVFTSSFSTPAQLTLAVVKALNEQQRRDAGGDALPAARERTAALAAGERRSGYSSGRTVRIAIVPVDAPTLLDAYALEDATLTGRVIEAARRCGVFTQTAGAELELSSAGIAVRSTEQRHGEGAAVTFAADGSVCVEMPVQGEGTMGGMVVSEPRVKAAVAATGRLADELWTLLPEGRRVGRVCAAIGVPDSQHAAYSLSGNTGGTMRMGSAPQRLLAPEPVAVLTRSQVTSPGFADLLAIPLKRAFADHGSVCD